MAESKFKNWQIVNAILAKRICLLVLFLAFSPSTYAQLILDFSPKDSNFPREIFKVEQIRYATADVSESHQFDIGESSLKINDQSASLDIGFIYYARKIRTLSYQGFDSVSDLISSGDYYAITKEDLPVKLAKDYGYIGIPVWIGESRINLYYGQLTLTDNQEVNEEDVVRFVDIEYYLTPEEDSTWMFGWYYADAFGGIYNVPFLGYVRKSSNIIAIQLVIPVKWSVGVAFANGWVLGLGQQVEGEAYRLTEEDPWKSAILSFTGIKSVAGIGYHFSGGWYFRIEAGTLTQQKVQFYKDSISISSNEISEEAYLSGDLPLMELSLKDTAFYGVSLSWAF